ncbi:MAG: DUF616 domain-containing protein [Lachnospiraceae bacterium]|nr:DUF616 domain-containing protein [Lachnospiraceae bacterium]
MKIVLWGAGDTGRNIWKQISKKNDLYNDDYIAFADNNKELWGQNFCGKPILPHEEILKGNFDRIVITSIYGKMIFGELREKFHISPDQIQFWETYSREKTAQAAYKRQYQEENGAKQSNVFDRGKIVVYTAITGDYDELKDPAFLSPDIDYICFTNNKNIRSNAWNIQYVDSNSLPDQLLSRKIKLNPQIYFKEYNTSVWVDGKFKIQADIRDYIKKYEKAMPILCFPHYERACIYEEEAICMLLNFSDKEKLLNQVINYYSQKYPFDNGLYETGCMVRNHNDSKVIKIMKEWEKEITDFSIRDQISLPYVCWKNNFLPDISDVYINDNKWLKAYPHK